MLSLRSFTAAMLLCFLIGPVKAAEADFARELLAEINAFRSAEGLSPLARDSKLDHVAQGRSSNLVSAGFVGHAGPGGRDLPARVEKAGYSYRLLAENIAAGLDDPKAVLASWLDSPPHAHNLRLAEVSEIGLGYSPGGDSREEAATDVSTVILAAPAVPQAEPGSESQTLQPRAIVVSQPAYIAQSTLKPRGSVQGTP